MSGKLLEYRPDEPASSHYKDYLQEIGKLENLFLIQEDNLLNMIEKDNDRWEIGDVDINEYIKRKDEILDNLEILRGLPRNSFSDLQLQKAYSNLYKTSSIIALIDEKLQGVEIPPIKKEYIEEYLYKNHLFLTYSLFEHYLYSILNEIYNKFPEKLDKQSVLLSDLRKKSKEEILQEKIDNMITTEILQGNAITMMANLKKLGNINHNLTRDEIEKLYRIQQIRNLWAHSNGIVNTIFINRLGDSSLKMGEKFTLSKNIVKEAQKQITLIIEKIDKRFVEISPNDVL